MGFVEMTWEEIAKFPSNYSLDRLNPKGDYNPENCVLCCYASNIGRGDCPQDQWTKIVKEIKNNLINEKRR